MTPPEDQPKRLTPLKAIRQKCLDCCCFQPSEVKKCGFTDCPLYPFRMGHNPALAGEGPSNPFGNKKTPVDAGKSARNDTEEADR